MFFKQKRFRKIPTAIEALQNEFYIGIESSKLNEKDLLNIGITQDFIPLVEGIDFLPSKIGKFSTMALLQIAADGKLNTLLAKGSADECFPWSSFSGRNHSLGRPLVL
jgi:hypothetical protein